MVQFAKFLGIKHSTTTAFNPRANGIIENVHKWLKQSLRSYDAGDWDLRLPIAVLTWNNTIKEDLLYSPSQLVFGNADRLPCDLFEESSVCEWTADLVKCYFEEMNQLKATRMCLHSNRYPFYVNPDLSKIKEETAGFLQAQYKGPFPIVERAESYFVIKLLNGKLDKVNYNRLKPALFQI